jgi:hypothetical protein
MPIEKLKELVAEHGMSETARILDVHRTTVHNVLKGNTSMSDAMALKLGFVRWWVPVECVQGDKNNGLEG